ncbi:uncharacterized protein LOC131523653 [Onychostoma macrolepis]|uniref:uncharacterized protein LOC131523653 n=1 Tax=Onychostoma macrolepis TaxID=369639 RepID=UPI00272CF3C4|nr:uncharacterized protein LOC131523653 [Onychostoma macrolepis]
MIFIVCLIYLAVLPFWVSGVSLSDQVHQNPLHLITNAEKTEEEGLICSSIICSFHQMSSRASIAAEFLYITHKNKNVWFADFALLLPLGLGLNQSPHLFVTEDLNVTLKCSQIGTSHNSMYWFRKTPTEPLEQIVYFYFKSETWEKDFKQRASAVRNGASLDLTLVKVQSSDSGVYYCAKQDAHQCNPIYNLHKNMQIHI